MPKKVVITADSTCDLPPELVERYDIRVLPLYINLGDRVCRDGIDVTPDDIYAFVAETGALPTTSAINPGEYHSAFTDLRKKNDCDIIHINISSDMSSCHQNARTAAESMDGVYAVDSLNLSTASGHLAIEAAEMANAGAAARDIEKELLSLRQRVDASFVLDTLLYLRKGGRCSSVAALGANLLRLKPCIEVKNGKMGVGKKYRGAFLNVLEEYAADRLNKGPVKGRRVFITHSGCSEMLIETVRKKVDGFDLFDDIIINRAGCTISSHCGPNTLGVLFIGN